MSQDVEMDKIVVAGDDFDKTNDRVRQVTINGLNELQGKLAEWQTMNFKSEDCAPHWMALGVAEEVGEICHVILKSRQKIREFQDGLDSKAKAKLADGIGDAVVYMMQLCTKTGLSFAQVVFEIAEEVMKRDWTKKKLDGVTK